MAREESDREDLLRDATALVERIEFARSDAGEGEHIFVGFRADGAMSIYLGADPVYHFNSAGELRRAYCDGWLIKAESGRLVAMERRRQEHEVQLVRRELSDDAQAAFLGSMSRRLHDLEQRLRSNSLSVVGQVPPDADVLGRVDETLAELVDVKVAKSPSVH
jgi:hypothetical protein